MRLVSLSSIGDAELEAWGRLCGDAAEPNPFFEPSFAIPAAKALGGGRVQLLIAEDPDGEWLGCLPVETWRGARRLLAAGWTHPYSFLGTPLVATGRTDAFATALVDSLRAGRPCRYLLLRAAADGPVLAAIDAAAAEDGEVKAVFERRFERGAYRGRTEEEQLGWMGSRRGKLRRQRRKLEKELGEEVAVRERGGAAEAVEEFLHLEQSGWKGQQRTAMASDDAGEALFRDVCREFAADRRLRMRALEADGRVLAMTCELSAGGVLFGFKSAYDEQLRSYSPGIQLHVDNFGSFDRERPERLLDSCGDPESETINRLFPDRVQLRTVAFGRAGLRGRLLGRALERRDAVSRREPAAGG